MEPKESDPLLSIASRSRVVRKTLAFSKTWLAGLATVGLVTFLCVASVYNFSPPAVEEETFDLGAEGPTTTVRSRRRSSSPPTVTTGLGKVTGLVLQSRAGRDYFGFYNVPYGQPPVGELRFMPPKPALAWEGTKDATVKGPMCVQKARYNPNATVEGREDCLYVNVFTPKLPRFWRRVSLPVITYFFGGAFMHGDANDFNTDYFMDEEVVLVIVQSRVGALGFLNTGDLAATGNQGLKDQSLALKWVQDNIKEFGGDPTRVVAFGTSSGAMCAHGHLLSPMSKGLFSGVMSLSGTATMPGQIGQDPRVAAVKFGKAVGCDLADSFEMVKCLQNVTADDIALNQPDEFSPSIEALPLDGNLTGVFFPDAPLNLLLTGNVNKVPWIIGVNSAEAILQSYSLILAPEGPSSVNNDWDTVIPEVLGLTSGNSSLTLDIAHRLRDFYFEGNKTLSKDSLARFNFTDMLSDRYFIHPTKMAGMLQAQHSSVYRYYLTKEANVSFADSVNQYFDPPYGVSHADEVQYFFFRPRYPYIPLDSEYAEFSKMIVKLWVSFAETGIPVNPLENGVEWPAVDPSEPTGKVWFNLDDEPKLVEPFTDRLKLWDSFPFDLLYNQNATSGATSPNGNNMQF